MNNRKKEILSYYELRKFVDQSKSILNKDTLDYLDSLLNLEISVLHEDKNDYMMCKYLKELEMYRELVLYNIYNNSMKLANDDVIISEYYNQLNFNVRYKNINFNIYSFDYNDIIPNIYLYRKNMDLDSFDHNQSDFIVTYAREAILEKFLSKNNLKLFDFDDECDSYGVDRKVKKYGYANIYIK